MSSSSALAKTSFEWRDGSKTRWVGVLRRVFLRPFSVVAGSRK